MSSEPIVLNDQQALNLFAKGNLKDVIAFYKKNGNNFKLPYDSNPLHYAALNKANPLVLLYLLKDKSLKTKVNELNNVDSHPLELAASKLNIKGIEYLIYYGADYQRKYKGNNSLDSILIGQLRGDLIPTIKQIIAEHESGKVLDDEKLLATEVEQVTKQQTSPPVKPQNNSFTTYFACGLSRIFHGVKTSYSATAAEARPHEQEVPLLVKKGQ